MMQLAPKVGDANHLKLHIKSGCLVERHLQKTAPLLEFSKALFLSWSKNPWVFLFGTVPCGNLGALHRWLHVEDKKLPKKQPPVQGGPLRSL